MSYTPELEATMRRFYTSLSEKDRRRYAAIETAKLGHGGLAYVAAVLGCDPKTIRRGQDDLTHLPDALHARVRKRGGGRKRCRDTLPQLEANFLQVLAEHTAGDPMRADVKWTHLTQAQIADHLAAAGTPVSVPVVKQLLRQHRYVKRKARKAQAMGAHADRDAQFENITRLKAEYLAANQPVVSMDTKKKERLGNFFREGRLYTQGVLETFDHDFPSAATGVVIPHGLYDVQRNTGHVNLGTSHDTSEFACDSLRHWWESRGRSAYPEATRLLVLCDGGGSNSASQYLFKEDLQRLADHLGLEIRVAHYPPYASKYNPIEHRFFPHLTRACQGVIFHTIDTVKELMEGATTRTGLTVTVDILDQVYRTGRKYAADFKATMKIVFDATLPKWNYRACPSGP